MFLWRMKETINIYFLAKRVLSRDLTETKRTLVYATSMQRRDVPGYCHVVSCPLRKFNIILGLPFLSAISSLSSQKFVDLSGGHT